MAYKRLGDMLVSVGLITEQQLTAALEEQKKDGRKLGEILAREKQYDEAIQILTESAAIQKEMLDEDNPRYLKTLEYLAEVCVRKGDYTVAVQHYLAINDANYEETAEEKQRAAETLLAVAVCYLAMGNEKKAEAYRKEAVEKLSRAGGGLT